MGRYICVNCGRVVNSKDLASIRCPKCGYKGLAAQLKEGS